MRLKSLFFFLAPPKTQAVLARNLPMPTAGLGPIVDEKTKPSNLLLYLGVEKIDLTTNEPIECP